MKEYIVKNKMSLINHVVSLGILLIGFALGRYVFFGVHGMKEFPVTLFVLGLAVMLISVLTSKRFCRILSRQDTLSGSCSGFFFRLLKWMRMVSA